MANFSKNCGAGLETGSRFCKACGAKVGTAAVKAPAARPAPIPAAPRSSSTSRGAAAQARNTPQRSSARTPAPEKPKKSRKGLAVFLVLVVLAGLAFAAF